MYLFITHLGYVYCMNYYFNIDNILCSPSWHHMVVLIYAWTEICLGPLKSQTFTVVKLGRLCKDYSFYLMHTRPCAFFHYIRCCRRGQRARPEIKLHFAPPGSREQKWQFYWPVGSGYHAHRRSLKNKQEAKACCYWLDIELVNLFAVVLWLKKCIEHTAHVHVKADRLGSSGFYSDLLFFLTVITLLSLSRSWIAYFKLKCWFVQQVFSVLCWKTAVSCTLWLVCCIVCLCLTGSDWNVSQKQWYEVICSLCVFRLVCGIFKNTVFEGALWTVRCLFAFSHATCGLLLQKENDLTCSKHHLTFVCLLWRELFYATAHKLKSDMRFYSW